MGGAETERGTVDQEAGGNSKGGGGSKEDWRRGDRDDRDERTVSRGGGPGWILGEPEGGQRQRSGDTAGAMGLAGRWKRRWKGKQCEVGSLHGRGGRIRSAVFWNIATRSGADGPAATADDDVRMESV